ncbi:MAG: DUF5320 domain-containing protein [Actinobacteria bacterium]|nr:DUF5320 domain-containing protein [Actinomycetota bacterium]
MPGGDRTGPSGMGPLTGRGAGYCSGSDAPGFMNLVRRGFSGTGRAAYSGSSYLQGRGFPASRRGRGRGRGFGRGMFRSF